MAGSPGDLVRRAIQREPRLTYFGLGVFDEKNKRPTEIKREFGHWRAHLLSPLGLAEVALCAQWLRTEGAVDARNSYGLKHDVENWADVYVSNGALIAAALGLGFEYERAGPNVVLAARR